MSTLLGKFYTPQTDLQYSHRYTIENQISSVWWYIFSINQLFETCSVSLYIWMKVYERHLR